MKPRADFNPILRSAPLQEMAHRVRELVVPRGGIRICQNYRDGNLPLGTTHAKKQNANNVIMAAALLLQFIGNIFPEESGQSLSR